MINDKNKDTWCVNASHGMSGNNDGGTKLCCMYKEDFADRRHHLVLGEQTIEQHFTNPIFQQVRSDLNNGIKNHRCNYCWNEEAAGRASKRIRDNKKYLNRLENGQSAYNNLAYFELNLGNTCNLACRTCNPYISSGWMKESFDTEVTGKTYKEYAMHFKRFHQSYDDESPFWEDLKLHLPDIKQFDFYGGEPLMSKKMWEILKICVEKGYSKEIELHYNTNGTHYPDKELELWKHFKEVNVSFSIDGIGDKFEYMRYPARWDEVNENMRKFVKFSQDTSNIFFNWCITISTTNVYDIPEVIDYYYDNYRPLGFSMYLNLVHGPAHHNIGILPKHIKEVVAEKLNAVSKEKETAWDHIPGVINFMNQQDFNEKEFNKFCKVTATSDKYRSQNFKETFNEFGEYFDSNNFQ